MRRGNRRRGVTGVLAVARHGGIGERARRVGPSARLATIPCRDIAWFCARCAGGPQREPAAARHLLFRAALVPGAAGVLLGFAQFWREARGAYLA